MNIYNEIEPFACDWLENLIDAGHIAPGEVDRRSIVDLEPADVAHATQFHTFAGIGVWSYALRLAGWPDDLPVWTTRGFGRGSNWHLGRDGGIRPAQPSAFPLVNRTPGRVGRLRAYGNAIVPQVAAAFISSFVEALVDVG